jgi:Ca2+-binding RTX toxin-like protein
VQYGAFGFPDATLSTSIGGGANFFAGGPGPNSVAEQIIDVSAAQEEVDAGLLSLELSAHIGGFLTDADNMTITAALESDDGDTIFETVQIGPVSDADRGDITDLLPRSTRAEVPAGTRKIRLLMSAVRTDGAYNDAYADNVSIVFDIDPVAVDDFATVGQDAPATEVDVLTNDTDVDGGPIGIESVTQPTGGTVSVTGGGTGLTYQPTLTFCNDRPGDAPDAFTYTLNGGSTATVSVAVPCLDAPPMAAADEVTIAQNSEATTITVLANDTDSDGGPMLVLGASQPANGTVAVSPGGAAVTYKPHVNYCNGALDRPPDSFTYTLNGGSTAPVSVSIPCLLLPGPPGCAGDSVFPIEPVLSGTPANDLLVGTNASDELDGLAGDDCLFGGAGNDRLAGGSGSDRLIGEQQSDRLSGDSGSDLLRADSGNDRLSGGSGDDRLSGDSGNDALTPGSGTDRVDAGSGRDTVSARDGSRDLIDCGSSRDRVTADRRDRIARTCEQIRH